MKIRHSMGLPHPVYLRLNMMIGYDDWIWWSEYRDQYSNGARPIYIKAYRPNFPEISPKYSRSCLQKSPIFRVLCIGLFGQRALFLQVYFATAFLPDFSDTSQASSRKFWSGNSVFLLQKNPFSVLLYGKRGVLLSGSVEAFLPDMCDTSEARDMTHACVWYM